VAAGVVRAVSAKGALRFAVYEGNTNAATFIDFCKRLLHDAPEAVYLIVDGHPAHRAAAVKQYAASTGGRLKLFRLPGYSPSSTPMNGSGKTSSTTGSARPASPARKT
jgi:transposase